MPITIKHHKLLPLTHDSWTQSKINPREFEEKIDRKTQVLGLFKLIWAEIVQLGQYKHAKVDLKNLLNRKIIHYVQDSPEVKTILQPAPKDTLDLLKAHKLFAKIILPRPKILFKFASKKEKIFKDHAWISLIDQMAYPEERRLERRALHKGKPKYIYDPKTDKFQLQNQPNFYRGSTKTSVTLMPSNVNMDLFSERGQGSALGLLFDVDKCQTKEDRFVFLKDSITAARWWRTRKKNEKNTPKLEHQESLDDLRKKMVSLEKLPEKMKYNEVFTSVTKEAVKGILCSIGAELNADSVLLAKLSAISKQKLLLEKLGVKAPIFFKKDGADTLILFSKEEQTEVLKRVLKNNKLDKLYEIERQTNEYMEASKMEFREKIKELAVFTNQL